jgi:hypothetical protein
LTPLKLVIGGLAMYKPATILAVSVGTAVLLAPSQLTIRGHVFEKVLFSGVNESVHKRDENITVALDVILTLYYASLILYFLLNIFPELKLSVIV